MTNTYDHTISGLLRRRSELMGEAMSLREELARVGNTIESLDHVLRSMGYHEPLDGMRPRSNRVVFFARNELRRFLIDELRKANGHPVTSRDMAEKIIQLEGKDGHDRRLVNDMVKRVGKSFKLLRAQGMAVSQGQNHDLTWKLKACSPLNPSSCD